MKITEKNEFILKIKAYITLKGISFFPVILHPKNLTFFSRFDKEINIVSNKIKHHNFEIHKDIEENDEQEIYDEVEKNINIKKFKKIEKNKIITKKTKKNSVKSKLHKPVI